MTKAEAIRVAWRVLAAVAAIVAVNLAVIGAVTAWSTWRPRRRN